MALTPLVLVVDDDRVVLHALQEQLARDAYRVVALSRVLPALDHLSRETFTVILADQFMPGMSGLEFLRKCREIQPLCTRIAITGLNSLPGIQDALAKGLIHRFLLKPWNRLDLLLALRQGVERFETLQEVATLSRENKRQREELASLVSRLREAAPHLIGGMTAPAATGPDLFDQVSGEACESPKQSRASEPAKDKDAASALEQTVHDFRNHLASILSYTELVLARPDLLSDREKILGYLDLIRTATLEAQTSLNRLQDSLPDSPAESQIKAGLSAKAV